jgi:hypothetical protein
MTTEKRKQKRREWRKKLTKIKAKWRRQEVKEAKANVVRIEARISELQDTIRASNDELVTLARDLVEARAKFVADEKRGNRATPRRTSDHARATSSRTRS